MLGRLWVGVALATMMTAPAFAAGACGSPPVAPASIDGSTATQQQVKDAISDFKTFQNESDTYQSCLWADLKKQQDAAEKSTPKKTLDPTVAEAVQAQVTDNQRLKEKVGGELNAAIKAYQSKHKT
jgi:hypothetical protein